jgi:tetratricopeptide (TPR) repeat protein
MLKHLTGRTILFWAVLSISVSPAQIRAQAQNLESSAVEFLAQRDSLIKGYTLDELEKYRALYQREISRLESERSDLRRRGIRDEELFLARHPQSRIADKVMMRLAELYYEQAQDDFQTQMQEFDRQYALFERGEALEAPAEPKKNLTAPLNLYASVVEKFPQGELVDDAFYNIGFLLEEIGSPDSALAYYSKILKEFPETPLLPDVYMRIAEYYFNPPVNEIVTAISYYQKVLPYRDSPRYDEALYRLGWSHYRINEYSKAISYFTLLVDDVGRSQQYDPLQKYTNPSLVDESVEYIGLSFLESGGPEAAARYFREIGGREYGAGVFKRMGDAYMDEKEDYIHALDAYNLLLQIYPDNPIAPTVQNRIVQAYRRLENEPLAYLARDLLFTKYRENSDWWNKNTDTRVRKTAYSLTESAMRDNVSVLQNRAQETGQEDLYRQSVVESRRYLAAFPGDSTAPLIHWNMALTLDTKLRRITEAYQEYLKISNSYWDSKYQRFAAENAVALARDAAMSAVAAAEQKASEEQPITISDLKKQAGEQASRAFSFRERMQLQPTELSANEKRLAEAYDNYIKLFPHGQETTVFLANAGALYYRHHQFKEALKYFNTLLRHFPGSEEVGQARFAIMESYFGKADFRSSEIVARRIVYSDASEEIQSKARRRLAESIYLSAEMLAEQNKHIEAGDEYRRMVKEVPRSSFADLALFNAALEYDKASDYMRAIETYNFLLASHPNSGYVLDAQNNLAFDYVELNDYHNAALIYERIAAIHPDADKARDALYNSSLYFAKSQDWPSAIKINNLFIQRFPNDDVADDLSYEIAGFHEKQGEPEKAQDAYQTFVDSYPTSPRIVEAFFRRGSYYKERGDSRNAIIEYEKALVHSREFEKGGLDRNDYFASETEFALAETKFEDYEQIRFRLPQAELNRNKDRKKDLLLEIVRHLGNCAAYGTYRVYEATYMVGLSYEEFASTWAAQELPEMDRTRRIVAQKEVGDAATELYQRSADAFRNSIVALGRLSSTYQETLIKEANQDTSRQTPVDTTVVASEDSILRIAHHWINRAKTKLTEVNYEIGEISLASAKSVMQAPLPRGLGDFPSLIYRQRVMDLAVAPLIDATLNAYRKNLTEADSLSIQSQWVDLSKQKLIATKNLFPSAYSELAIDGLDLMHSKLNDFAKLVNGSRSFDEVVGDFQDLSDEIANALDFSKASITTTTTRYRETIEMANALGIQEEFIIGSKDSMMVALLSFGTRCDSLGRYAKKQADHSRTMFVSSNSPMYEEGLFTFESNYFALRNVEREVLKSGYDSAKQFGIDNLYSKNLALHLVRFDPESYAGLLDLKIATTSIVTDTTWRATSVYAEGWPLVGFDASDWNLTEFADASAPASGIWTFATDTSFVGADSQRVVERRAAPIGFFRKTFSVKGLPVACQFRIPDDLQYNLYFNGDLIQRAADSDSAAQGTFNLSDLLINGVNVLAIEMEAKNSKPPGFSAIATIKSLPDWDQKLEMLRPELASDKVRQQQMLEKGRIP